jgi:septal ring-binding cell division protein DamX
MARGPRPGLGLIDRLVLLAAWLVTCGLVYVLGYYVGRGAPDRQAANEERTVRLPVTSTPPSEGQRPKEAKEFPTFYQALPAGERPIDVARGTPVTAPASGSASTAPPPRAVRSTTTLPAAFPTPTTLGRPAVTTTTQARPAATTTLVRPAPTLPPTSTTTLSRPPATLGPPATPPTTVPPNAAPPVPPSPPRATGRGGFTVEASPTRSRSEAEHLMVTLRRRGYDATLVEVERDGDTWYRLRVGRYPTAEQATDAMRRLRDVEGMTHVFVAAE